jgi:thioredoxin
LRFSAYDSETKSCGAAQHPEGCKEREAQADGGAFAEEDARCLGQGRREGGEAQTPAAAMSAVYAETEPTRAEVEALEGPTLVEFGSPWCGYCSRAQPLIEEAFAGHPRVRHIKIADASGRRLGRSFHVKLWPTLVFLNQGKEISRLVRPAGAAQIRQALDQIDLPAPG